MSTDIDFDLVGNVSSIFPPLESANFSQSNGINRNKPYNQRILLRIRLDYFLAFFFGNVILKFGIVMNVNFTVLVF